MTSRHQRRRRPDSVGSAQSSAVGTVARCRLGHGGEPGRRRRARRPAAPADGEGGGAEQADDEVEQVEQDAEGDGLLRWARRAA